MLSVLWNYYTQHGTPTRHRFKTTQNGRLWSVFKRRACVWRAHFIFLLATFNFTVSALHLPDCLQIVPAQDRRVLLVSTCYGRSGRLVVKAFRYLKRCLCGSSDKKSQHPEPGEEVHQPKPSGQQKATEKANDDKTLYCVHHFVSHLQKLFTAFRLRISVGGEP